MKAEIGVIVSNMALYTMFLREKSIIKLPVQIELTSIDRCLDVAHNMIKDGIKVIVSRGAPLEHLREHDLCVPIIELSMICINNLKQFYEAISVSQHIAVVASKGFITYIKEICTYHHVDLFTYEVYNDADSEKGVFLAKEKGYQILFGGDHAVELATSFGMQGINTTADPEAIHHALRDAESIVHRQHWEQRMAARQELILDALQDAVIFFNASGSILYSNRAARQIVKNTEMVKSHFLHSEILRRYITEGSSIQSEVIPLFKKDYVVTLIPQFENGIVSGAIAIFQEMENLRQSATCINRTNQKLSIRYSIDSIISRSPIMDTFKKQILEYAGTPFPVCLVGESGTGKELVAQSIHMASAYADGPFVAVNCAKFQDNLLESELFGYTEGMFTGARRGGKPGIFEMVNNGTLFLDEVSEISLNTQIQLLRVLEENASVRLGSVTPIPLNVRIICAFNRDPRELIREGKMRSDFFYRISILCLAIPPLRERPGDIGMLAEHFAATLADKAGKSSVSFTRTALNLLEQYSFPGNVRELRSMVIKLIMLSRDGKIRSQDVQKMLAESTTRYIPSSPEVSNCSDNPSIQSVTDSLIRSTLAACNGNKQACALRLGISQTTLWRRLRRMATSR